MRRATLPELELEETLHFDLHYFDCRSMHQQRLRGLLSGSAQHHAEPEGSVLEELHVAIVVHGGLRACASEVVLVTDHVSLELD